MRRVLVTLTTLFLLAPLGQVRGMEPTLFESVPMDGLPAEVLDESTCQPIEILSPLAADEYLPGNVTFAWEPVSKECLEEQGIEEAVYLVQIYKIKADEHTMYDEFKSYGPTEDRELSEPGKYRWVVSLLAGEPMFSSEPDQEPRFYIIDESVQVPTLTSPVDGVWLPEGSTLLTWKGEPTGSRADACTWNVRYAEVDATEWMLVEGISETELELILGGGVYEWQAQCETYWARGPWAEPELFGIDDIAPTVAIAGSTPLTVALGATLQFSGTAQDLESGVASLRFRIIQGSTEILTWTNAASLEAFAGSAVLPAGTYELQVEAVDAVGNATTTTRAVSVVVPTPTPENGGIGGNPSGTTVVVAQVPAPTPPVQVAVSVPAPVQQEEEVAPVSPSPTPTPDQGDVAGATTDDGNTGSTTFWWWLLLTAVAFFIIWFLIARRRDEEEQQK